MLNKKKTNNDYETVKRIGMLYEEALSLRKNYDYVVNQPQMDKFNELSDFFNYITQKSNGKTELSLSPKEEHGGINATFGIFDIYGEDIPKFCKAMSYASAIGIDECKDGVCISVTVPNVFVPRKKVKD